MARVSHRTTGLDALRRRLSGLSGQAQAAAATGLAEIAANAADLARADLASGASPSAAGSPPADPSGRLAASIAARVDPETGHAAVAVAAPEAHFLEYGTARMAARPFLRPAALRAAQQGRATLRAALLRGLKP